MRCILIGGFLGSGKTTMVRKLVEHLGKQGQRTAVIVNEIGEIGIDGGTISEGEIEVREIASGCICCALRISMEHTLRSLIASYSPDTLIIEPTGIAFPDQIKRNIENMGIPEISFAPIVNLVDAGRLSQDKGELQNFMKNQISDAELLGINKVELINCEELLEICLFLRKLNPKARMVHFSARLGGENFDKLLKLLDETGRTKTTDRKEIPESRDNSVQMSGVSAYSSEFEIISQEIPLETAISVSEQILNNIKNRVKELNSEFTGHIKLSFAHKGNFVKGSVTSAHRIPEIEILKKEKNERSRIKVLSAVTSVPQAELIEAVDVAIRRQLEDRMLSFKKSEITVQGITG
ncbi:GTP-binding protein [Methanosarcina sp. MSH10X1]|uniref:CobW family GTP-binding protein n=1 Tax=Methanosarcina sp. MSH10X1 TaxID=2507075 RepID=UPI000FFB520C|nr:GTP-binding protein [Methanosarcina sp. MSH10X1]RXA17998.1 GTP-binding protein [Methanosarcina sp. MSH10X1]